MRHLATLALLAALAGCTGGGRACGPAGAAVENASSLAIEQLFLASGPDWGPDLLGQAPALAAAGRMPLTFDGPGPWRLRAVWVTGRAIELGGINGCHARRIIIRDDVATAD
ncbi:hypothetical protein [Belnapia sp. F-4-1]|uniref:hypothetical protein n=1 Tax=Belnapia sp. F-4-1 TaxID=1545443 RepID=UPI0005BD03F0|nr:hypothetical protein [Belnapia sp. F-4-1]